VTLLPRTDSSLVNAMLVLLRLILFTLGICLVVGVGALLLWAVLTLADGYTDSTRVRTVLALAAFVLYVAVPAYLLAVGTDDGDDGDEGGDREAL